MPELPEVEVCRRRLAEGTAGRVLVAVRVEDRGVVRPSLDTRPASATAEAMERMLALRGSPLGPLVRRGKRIAWSVGRGGLLLHLGMTGRWVRGDAEAVPRHGRLGLGLDDGTWWWFVDPRRFGCVVPVERAALDRALAEGLGPDALVDGPDGASLAALLRTARPIKVALLDQARLAGVGNIQAVEALHRAGVHPDASADSLTGEDWSRLAEGLRDTLLATIRDLEREEEVHYLSDGAANPFAVYGRGGQACRSCGTILQVAPRAGRVTTWCPSCQPRRSYA